MGGEFDIMQFIKDFQISTVIFIIFFGLMARKEGLEKIKNLADSIERLEKRQSEHYERLWKKLEEHDIEINKLGKKVAKIESDIEYLKKR